MNDVLSRVRDAQVLELITIVSEITNVLNFDLKHIELKDDQIKELKLQNDKIKDSQQQAESAKNQDIELFKTRIKQEIEQVKIEYEQEIKR